MTIKEAEEKTGLARSNIRFYEKEGLLHPRRSAVSGYKDYTEEDVLTLNRIKILRMLDMPVRTIRECLEGEKSLEEALGEQQDIYQEQMEEIHRKQTLCQQFQRMEGGMEALSREFLSEVCSDREGYLAYLETLRKRERSSHRFFVFQQVATIGVCGALTLAAIAFVMNMQYRTVGIAGVVVSIVMWAFLFGLIGRIIYLSDKRL